MAIPSLESLAKYALPDPEATLKDPGIPLPFKMYLEDAIEPGRGYSLNKGLRNVTLQRDGNSRQFFIGLALYLLHPNRGEQRAIADQWTLRAAAFIGSVECVRAALATNPALQADQEMLWEAAYSGSAECVRAVHATTKPALQAKQETLRAAVFSGSVEGVRAVLATNPALQADQGTLWEAAANPEITDILRQRAAQLPPPAAPTTPPAAQPVG